MCIINIKYNKNINKIYRLYFLLGTEDTKSAFLGFVNYFNLS